MSKRHHNHKAQPNHRAGTAVSIDPEEPFETQLKPSASSPLGFEPEYQDIQRRAYEIHQQKGGTELDNWLEAERLIKEERRKAQGLR